MNWEYKTFVIDAEGIFSQRVDQERTERKLNELGAQGWELVGSNSMTRDGYTKQFWFVFKRPVGQQ